MKPSPIASPVLVVTEPPFFGSLKAMEFSLLSFVSQVSASVHALQWPSGVWWTLAAIFALSFLFCLREMAMWVLGAHSLRREVTQVRSKLADLQGEVQDLRERVEMLEAGVEGFDRDGGESTQQRFEIHH